MNCSICGLPKGNIVGSVLPQCLCGWQKPNPPVTQRETWTPVEIGVDVTKEGTHVVGMYILMPEVVRYVFYSKFHPAPQRTWHGLTDEDIWDVFGGRIGTSNSDVNPIRLLADARKIEDKLKERNG